MSATINSQDSALWCLGVLVVNIHDLSLSIQDKTPDQKEECENGQEDHADQIKGQ